MDISSGLVLKALGGLGAAGIGATGIYFASSYLQSSPNLNRFDKALINVLEDEDQDVVFKVTQSDSDTTTGNDITTDNFPAFNSNSSSIFVKVVVETSSTSQFAVKTGADASTKSVDKTISKLKELNKNGSTSTGWTWTCEIKLSKPAGESITEIADKELLLKSSNPEGFFNILKKNLMTDTSSDATKKKEWRNKKIKFIKNCASNRGLDKNKEIDGMTSITGSSDPLKTTKEFSLVKGDTTEKLDTGSGNQVATKLYFSDYSEFNKWFR